MSSFIKKIKSIFIIILLFSFGCGILLGEETGYVTHKMKKGESIYSVARQYGVTLDDIYAENPFATKGVKTGQILRIPEVKDGQASIKEEKNFNDENNKKEKKEIRNKSNSEKFQSENNLPEVLEDESLAEENMENIVNEEGEGTDIFDDDIEAEADTIVLMTEEPNRLEEIKIVLLLDDPNSKKDIDFARGFIMGLTEYKENKLPIDLNVVDGRIATGQLLDQIEEYEPTLIISTADKAFPAFLADYGNTNGVEIVNVFDLKNDLYEDNPSIIQILPPSAVYSEKLGSAIYNDNKYRKVIMVGNKDENDGLADELLKNFDDLEAVTLEDFGSFAPDLTESLLVYCYATRKEEIADFLQALENIKELYPGVNMAVVGRSNWVALIDEYGDKFKEYEIILPSRIWLDEDSEKWKKFCEKYEEFFYGTPVRSIPNFAASGYDIATFFIPLLSINNGNFNDRYSYVNEHTLQTDIILQKLGKWDGLVNNDCCLLQFRSSGEIEKVQVR